MRKKLLAIAAGGTALFMLLAPAAEAQTSGGMVLDFVLADNLFVLICAILVVFMQAGFAMVETGLTRAKNASHMMTKNLLAFAIGSIAFALVGYHIAFNGSSYFGFNWLWGGPDAVATVAPNLSMPVHFLFNMAFAATAATIVAGALAERVKFRAYFIYAFVISALIYPTVVSWVWGGGWLGQLDTPFIDFAGGSIVHVTGGMCALLGAKIAGPRIGRFGADGTSNPIPGHNVPLAILGVFVLLVSWFGFNTGSLLSAEIQIGHIGTITAMGAAAGALGALVTSLLTVKSPDVTLIMNGTLGGLVAITTGALNLSVFGGMITGLIGGVIATLGVLGLERLRIDDPVGAIPVHLMAGAWGTVAVGLLASPDAVVGGNGPIGFLYGGDVSQLLSQLVGLMSIAGFVALCAGTMFLILSERKQLRVSQEEEMLGLDISVHATPAYNDDAVASDALFDEILSDMATDADWLDA